MILALVDGDQVRHLEVSADGSIYAVGEADQEPTRVDARQVGPDRWSLLIGERSYEVRVDRDKTNYTVEMGGRVWTFCLTDPTRAVLRPGGGVRHGAGLIKAPMPGRVVKILVEEGQKVQHGDGLLVVEAMKMENELSAPRDGIIKTIHVGEGDTVEGNAELLLIDD